MTSCFQTLCSLSERVLCQDHLGESTGESVGRILLGAFAGFLITLIISIPLGILLPFVGLAIGTIGGAVAAFGVILCAFAGFIGGRLSKQRYTVYF